MKFVKLATAAALTLGVATAAIAQQTTPSAPQGQMNDRSTQQPSGAAGTGMNERSGATQSGPMTESSVKSMLQAQGYTDVKDVDKRGNAFTADAKKGGKSVKLNIDAAGNVTQARN
jgi:hypothetical protein